jgi:hypothetical protein
MRRILWIAPVPGSLSVDPFLEVKLHWPPLREGRCIFRKLCVNRGVDAVRQGRELGLC